MLSQAKHLALLSNQQLRFIATLGMTGLRYSSETARPANSSGRAAQPSRYHPVQPIRLGKGQDAQTRREQNAVPKRRAQHIAFLSHQVDGRDTYSDVLRRDHFAHDGSG